MTPIDDRITTWIASLERELADDDAAVRQDAVADAREHLLAARAELPDDADDAQVRALLDEYGDPVEVANSYRDAERLIHGERPATPRETGTQAITVATATPGVRPPAAGWFSVIRDQEAWTSLVYLLLGLPIGIASFVFTIAGGAVSGSLLILIFGIPLALAFLAAIRGIALVHGRLVEALLGERMPRRTRPISDEIGTGIIDRVKYWLRDRRTWTSIIYNVTMLPLGIAYFVGSVVTLSLTAFALSAPIVLWAASSDANFDVEWWHWLLSGVLVPAGAFGVFGVLHLARFVGGLHGRYTKVMLVGGEGASRRRRPVDPAVSFGHAAVFLAAGALLFGAVAIAGHSTARTTSHETTIQLDESNLTTLALDGDTADVDFIADSTLDPGDVRVEATTRVRDGHEGGDQVRLDRSGKTATLHGSCGGWSLFMWNCDTRIRVHVAPESGLALRGEVNTGDITLEGGWDRIDLDTDTGDIQGEIDAPHVDLSTNTGHIEGRFADAVEQADLETDTGDIEISASGTWNVDASADTGDIAIDVPRDSSSGHVLRASTDTGDIEIGRR
jgi:hypothetical protein